MIYETFFHKLVSKTGDIIDKVTHKVSSKGQLIAFKMLNQIEYLIKLWSMSYKVGQSMKVSIRTHKKQNKTKNHINMISQKFSKFKENKKIK